jgi:hypothetical protein
MVKYREHIGKEIKDHCLMIIGVINTKLLPRVSQDDKARVFYMKIKAD